VKLLSAITVRLKVLRQVCVICQSLGSYDLMALYKYAYYYYCVICYVQYTLSNLTFFVFQPVWSLLIGYMLVLML